MALLVLYKFALSCDAGISRSGIPLTGKGTGLKKIFITSLGAFGIIALDMQITAGRHENRT